MTVGENRFNRQPFFRMVSFAGGIPEGIKHPCRVGLIPTGLLP
ncbi:hypothetical protein HMPREF1555_00200 [Porphyromonas gingivalis F0570]|uniref:Uncharacterized protein n=1 Tax=Porphyromonas gingivalis F0570 TaxID=1227271 RepID=A0A0E2LTP8_PORGN|nr:hypothetical protein HMPREF1555_00200 [Porphyromonas gingivalis F0570]